MAGRPAIPVGCYGHFHHRLPCGVPAKHPAYLGASHIVATLAGTSVEHAVRPSAARLQAVPGEVSDGILTRFVMRGQVAAGSTLRESLAHSDIELLPAPANLSRTVGPLVTLFLWFECALSKWPAAGVPSPSLLHVVGRTRTRLTVSRARCRQSSSAKRMTTFGYTSAASPPSSVARAWRCSGHRTPRRERQSAQPPFPQPLAQMAPFTIDGCHRRPLLYWGNMHNFHWDDHRGAPVGWASGWGSKRDCNTTSRGGVHGSGVRWTERDAFGTPDALTTGPFPFAMGPLNYLSAQLCKQATWPPPISLAASSRLPLLTPPCLSPAAAGIGRAVTTRGRHHEPNHLPPEARHAMGGRIHRLCARPGCTRAGAARQAAATARVCQHGLVRAASTPSAGAAPGGGDGGGGGSGAVQRRPGERWAGSRAAPNPQTASAAGTTSPRAGICRWQTRRWSGT